MKNLFILMLLIIITGCNNLVAGDFPEKRQRLYDMGKEKEYCEKNPDRCIKGIPW